MENRDIIALLVKLGADVNAVDAAGRLPRTSFARVTNRARHRQAPPGLLQDPPRTAKARTVSEFQL
jgi:hypothetical protein